MYFMICSSGFESTTSQESKKATLELECTCRYPSVHNVVERCTSCLNHHQFRGKYANACQSSYHSSRKSQFICIWELIYRHSQHPHASFRLEIGLMLLPVYC